MLAKFRREFILASILLLVGLFFVQNAHAASLINASDTLSTSRPSASAPLATNQAASAGQVQIYDNGSYFLASDSAVLWPSTGETLNTVNIASMSAANIPSSGYRIVYFTNTAANTHHAGDPITVAATATHTIKFTANTTIPSGGQIILTFPTSTNTASPSATGFSFNGLATAGIPTYIQCNPTTACGGSGQSISGNTITLVTTAQQAGSTPIVVSIGCKTGVSSAGVCTAPSPLLINPAKINSAGISDVWKLTIQTTDTVANGAAILDSSKIAVGTIEAVQVQATVEPSITFTISGVSPGTLVCSNSDTTTAASTGGAGATSTFVSLGSLSNGAINISAQNIVVNTNGAAGYVITATSSGRFINPASGVWITDNMGTTGLTANDTPAPAAFPATGNPYFGIHPCYAGATSVPTIPAGWSSGSTAFGSGAAYSNPWNTANAAYYATIASYAAPATNSTTTVEYAATVGPTTPAGIYSNYFTYVATATF